MSTVHPAELGRRTDQAIRRIQLYVGEEGRGKTGGEPHEHGSDAVCRSHGVILAGKGSQQLEAPLEQRADAIFGVIAPNLCHLLASDATYVKAHSRSALPARCTIRRACSCTLDGPSAARTGRFILVLYHLLHPLILHFEVSCYPLRSLTFESEGWVGGKRRKLDSSILSTLANPSCLSRSLSLPRSLFHSLAYFKPSYVDAPA